MLTDISVVKRHCVRLWVFTLFLCLLASFLCSLNECLNFFSDGDGDGDGTAGKKKKKKKKKKGR